MRFSTNWTPFTVALSLCGLGVWLTCSAQETHQSMRGVRPFMRMKLEASTKVLEGLATENFRMISDSADKLKKMSTEERWRVRDDVLYRQYSAEFTQRVEKLQEKANAHNIDGATLAWVDCTMSCVRCHNHVRGIKLTAR